MSFKKKEAKRDLHQEVTDKILASLETGVAPWVRPWKVNPDGMDRNGETQRPYSGINVFLTAITSMAEGYTSSEWYTFNQVRKLGGHVKKGQHATMLVFFKPMIFKERDPKTGEVYDKKIPLLRNFLVFNRNQCEDLPERKPPVPRPEPVRREQIEAYVDATGARILPSPRDEQACYSSRDDVINMPSAKSFKSIEHYYSTLFHELGHWTGHPSRLDRKATWDREGYAFEELIAELTSAFLCSQHGVNGDLQHPEYIGNWIKKLKDDKKYIFSASSAASKAVAFMNGTNEAEQEEAA